MIPSFANNPIKILCEIVYDSYPLPQSGELRKISNPSTQSFPLLFIKSNESKIVFSCFTSHPTKVKCKIYNFGIYYSHNNKLSIYLDIGEEKIFQVPNRD